MKEALLRRNCLKCFAICQTSFLKHIKEILQQYSNREAPVQMGCVKFSGTDNFQSFTHGKQNTQPCCTVSSKLCRSEHGFRLTIVTKGNTEIRSLLLQFLGFLGDGVSYQSLHYSLKFHCFGSHCLPDRLKNDPNLWKLPIAIFIIVLSCGGALQTA